MTTFAHAPGAASLPSQGRTIAAVRDGAALVLRRIAVWHERAHGRAQLRALDSRMLRDIGLDPDAARAEARKPFWMA